MVETGFGIIVVAHEKHTKTTALLAAEHEMASEMKELKAKAEHWMGMDHGEKKAFEAWKTDKEFKKIHAAGQDAPRKHNAWWCKSCGMKSYLYKSCYNHECAANSTIAHEPAGRRL